MSNPVPDARQLARDARADQVRRLLADLDGCDDTTADRIKQRVAELTMPVARSIASRYRNRGVDLADLEQIAALGLMKAVHRWKPGLSEDFLQYAVPTISGEIKRFFRDRWWTVRPPRRLQEARAALSQAENDLRQGGGREPVDAELAAAMGTDIATVREAKQVRQSARFTSLEDPASDNGAIDRFLAGEDIELERVESRLDVAQMLASLGERDRKVLELRYFRGLSQAKIGDAIGVSQMQVSRILRDVTKKLREEWAESG
ncbi:MAG: sigma-70 family RNA polymerase sigma factor [Nakamurella sp.]